MKRSDTAMARRVDDEIVILDIESGQFFAINDVGAFIWDLLEAEVTIEELADAVAAEYGVDTETASGDVDELVKQLVDADLVTEKL
jgi:hypothetical protein